jgi:hypothetical protein
MTEHTPKQTPIFRAAAVQSYIAYHHDQVYPETISPALMRMMWLMIVVLSVALLYITVPLITI